MPDTIVKRVGGKFKIRKWIKSHLPDHTIYCEPFGGSFAVGLIMPPPDVRYRIVYNDLDKHVYNLFKVLRDYKEDFIEKVKFTPYSREEFRYACSILLSKDKKWLHLDKVEWARLYLVFNRQSFSGKEDGTWCISREGENSCLTWDKLEQLIDVIAKRLKQVYIECEDYREVIRRWDCDKACFYIDPPYEGVEGKYYHVNKDKGFDHQEMATFLKNVKGSVAISYYDSQYVRSLYSGFDIFEKSVSKHIQTNSNKSEATEILLVKKSDWAKKRATQYFDIFEEKERYENCN